MRVLLLRHGTATQRGAQGEDDPNRGLTGRGVDQCRMVAELLSRARMEPKPVFSSDYRRARETAEAVLEAAGLDADIREEPALRPGEPVEPALDLIRRAFDAHRDGCVLIVGHEPHLSSLCGALLGMDSSHLVLKKGGLVELEVESIEPLTARLMGLLRPRHLRSRRHR